MKTHFESESNSPVTTRLTLLVGLGFLFVLMATIASGTLSRLAAEAEETGSTVVWYVQGGHWREDVEIYLMHPEHIFFPTSTAATKNRSSGGGRLTGL